MSAATLKWKRHEAGWYTSQYGGVMRDADGFWYFFPIREDDAPKSGPWPTMKRAMQEAEA